MVDPEAVIALPGTGLIIPEGPDAASRVLRRNRVGPAICQQPHISIARFGLHQRIVGHGSRCPDIAVGRDDVVIAQHRRRDFLGHDRLHPCAQPFHPGQLVLELRPRLRIAVGEVDIDDARVEDIDLEKLELLIGLGSAIKNGELSIENAFPDSHAAGSKVGTSDVDAKFGKGKADDAASQAGANSDARKVPTLDDVKKEFDEARSKTSAKVIYNKYCGPDSTFGDDDRALIEASYQAACKRIDEAAARKKPGEQKELGDA